MWLTWRDHLLIFTLPQAFTEDPPLGGWVGGWVHPAQDGGANAAPCWTDQSFSPDHQRLTSKPLGSRPPPDSSLHCPPLPLPIALPQAVSPSLLPPCS